MPDGKIKTKVGDGITNYNLLPFSSSDVELIWENIEDKPENLAYLSDDSTEIEIPEPEYVKYTAQSLTDAQKEQVRSNIGATSHDEVALKHHVCNPNLLDNWYFANPVNQRGQMSYTAQWSYCLDRWLAPGIAHPVTIGNQYVSFDVLDQFISEVLPNGFYTASILLSNGSLYTGTAYYSVGLGIGLVGSNGVVDIYLMGDAISEGGNPRLRIQAVSGEPINFVAAKLELGDTQTLAHQDSSGNWVLNEIPDYGEQLARCQRYFYAFDSGKKDIYFCAIGNATQIPGFLFPVPMRTAPGITIERLRVWDNRGFVDISGEINSKAARAGGLAYIELNGPLPNNGLLDLKASFTADL